MSKRKQIMQSLRRAARAGKVQVFNTHTKQLEMVNVRDIQTVFEFSEDECREAAILRVALNLKNTNHPFHHRTASGDIVTPDPTLDYYLSRLSEDERKKFLEIYAPSPGQEAQTPKAIPVNRTYYGRDMYAGK